MRVWSGQAITEDMRAEAVVFTGRNQVEFREVTCPDPGPDSIVVRVTHSWISNGTEGSFLRGERTSGDVPWRPGDRHPFPDVAGYQKVGIVQQVGANITNYQVGQTVFSTVAPVEGMFSARGGHISPSVAAPEAVWALPADRDPVPFSGLVLTQVGYNCGARAPLHPGDPAVVIGDGMVGQWAAQTLAWRGAQVTLVGRHPDRLERWPGARINEREQDWSRAVRTRFPDGLQVVVDTVGSVAALEAATPLMRRFGHVVSAGFYGVNDRMALQPPRHGELSVDLVAGWTRERMDKTLDLVTRGVLTTEPLITHRFPVRQAAAAWDLLRARRENVLGVVLEWT